MTTKTEPRKFFELLLKMFIAYYIFIVHNSFIYNIFLIFALGFCISYKETPKKERFCDGFYEEK